MSQPPQQQTGNHQSSMIQRVALFVTCLVDQLMPEIGVAATRLLRRAGFQVDFPTEQTCCGQPFYNSGFRTETARLARHTIEVFEDYPAVILPSGSCAAMIRSEYPHLFQDQPEWHERAFKLAAKTFELSQFLVNHAHWQPSRRLGVGAVTYHDSCHANRMLGVREEPRQLLRSAGYAIKEMAESDRCCGFGGLFSVRLPETSNAITAEKLRLAAETGAQMLVTIDPGCLMQMRGLIDAGGIRAEHIAVVIEEATR